MESHRSNDNQFLEVSSEEDHQKQLQAVKLQARNSYIALLVFVLIISFVILIKQFWGYDQISKTDLTFYKQQLLSLQLDPFWKRTPEQLQQQQKEKGKLILSHAQHKISRQQLGRNSWTLLHMITGSFPQTLSQNLVKKFNIFLVLFGQMYPCKLCANHFMELLKKQGLFTGNTKQQLMKYLCRIHNKVNHRLGHKQHSCENIVQEWNTCGCSSQL